MLSRFSRTPTCDRHRLRHGQRRTQGHSIYRASIASRGKMILVLLVMIEPLRLVGLWALPIHPSCTAATAAKTDRDISFRRHRGDILCCYLYYKREYPHILEAQAAIRTPSTFVWMRHRTLPLAERPKTKRSTLLKWSVDRCRVQCTRVEERSPASSERKHVKPALFSYQLQV